MGDHSSKIHRGHGSLAGNCGHDEMRTILIVDDDTVVRSVFSLWLEKAGYSVTTATNGIEALKAFKTMGFDSVIMDINMPHVSGIEACRRMTSEALSERRPLVWLMTGLFTREVESAALAAGAQGILAKPFSGDYLIKRMEAVWAGMVAAQAQ